MVTVPANDLIRRAIKPGEDDPRMPAILEDDAWSMWLGYEDATPAVAKAVIKTMEGVNWMAAPEPKTPRRGDFKWLDRERSDQMPGGTASRVKPSRRG